jgi:uncharacterized protein (TIGR02588 family)
MANEPSSRRVRVEAASRRRSAANAIPPAEWFVGALGFILVVGVLGFLLQGAVRDNNASPDVRLSVNGVVELRNGYLVRLTALNEGGRTAQGLTVEGELRSGADIVERSEAVIDFLPSRSRKRAGMFFSRDPRKFELKLRPLGYAEP